MYCHGIATIALCEAHGATKDPGFAKPDQGLLALSADD